MRIKYLILIIVGVILFAPRYIANAQSIEPWHVEVWDNGWFSGSPIKSITVAETDPNFSSAASGKFPHYLVPDELISVRWQRTLSVDTPSQYVFNFDADKTDGKFRVTINGQLLVDNSKYRQASFTRFVPAGKHRIVVEYQRVSTRFFYDNLYYDFVMSKGEHAGPRIEQFEITPNPVPIKHSVHGNNGTEATVRWKVTGADVVTLYRDIRLAPAITLSAEGSIKISDYTGYPITIYAQQVGTISSESASATIDPPVCFRWFFSNPPTPSNCGGDLAHARQSLKIQYFERGVMIDRVDDCTLWFINTDSVKDAATTFGIGDCQIDEDENFDPLPQRQAPAGKFKPTGRFGRTWVRSSLGDGPNILGWATTQPIEYEGFVQSRYTGVRNIYYIAGPDDVVYTNEPAGWILPNTTITAPRNTTTQGGGDQHNVGCIIPPSGPWPPCATGDNSPSSFNQDCVIPPSGPWPPCARETPQIIVTDSGDGTGAGECVIPPSGPWPPCARETPQIIVTDSGDGTGGGTGCEIPPSGPWPPCAREGTQNPPGSGSDCIIPPNGPWPACAR